MRNEFFVKDKKEFVMCRHQLRDDEKLTIAATMADAQAEKDRLEEEIDGIKKDYKARILVAEAAARSCGEKLRTGYEMKEAECDVEVWPKLRIVKYVREVTGETVRTRPATDQDLQMQIEDA